MEKLVQGILNTPEHVALTYTVMLFCLGDMAVKVMFPKPGTSFRNDITVMVVGIALIVMFMMAGFTPAE